MDDSSALTNRSQSFFCLASASWLHVWKAPVVPGQRYFSGIMATSLWAVCKYGKFSASLLLLSVPHSQSACPCMCATSRKWCKSAASAMEGALSSFAGLPFPTQCVFCLRRKELVCKGTARLRSRSIMTNSPRIMDLNCCKCYLWYIFSLKRKGVKDFSSTYIFFSTFEPFSLLFNKSYEDF